jgi:hypothetical protein
MKKNDDEEKKEEEKEEEFFQKFVAIADYAHWDDAVAAAAEEFDAEYGVYPNILLAAPETLDKIDKAAKANHLERITDGDRPAAEEDDVAISDFVGPFYTLDFCIDYELNKDTICLIFDAQAEFGDEGDAEEEAPPPKKKPPKKPKKSGRKYD